MFNKARETLLQGMVGMAGFLGKGKRRLNEEIRANCSVLDPFSILSAVPPHLPSFTIYSPISTLLLSLFVAKLFNFKATHSQSTTRGHTWLRTTISANNLRKTKQNSFWHCYRIQTNIIHTVRCLRKRANLFYFCHLNDRFCLILY